MASNIICQKKIIMEVFDMWYKIPSYQRPYVWDTEQVTALLEDTYSAYQSRPTSEYFLGSMVLKINYIKETNLSYDEHEILDGQQRLTTLFLIMAVIRDLSVNPVIKDVCKKFIFQEENPFTNLPARLRIIFDIRDKVKTFVDKHIKPDDSTADNKIFQDLVDDKNEDVSIRHMANALLTIKNFLKGLEQADFENYFAFLNKKVLLIYVATEDLSNAFQLFTVLNDRGVRLRNSDILKSMNLSYVNDEKQQNKYAVQWEDMENYLGDDFDKFLSYVRTTLVKRKADMILIKEFEENIYSDKKSLLKKGSATFDYINEMFEIYQKVFDLKDINGDYTAVNYLTLMRAGFNADYWITAVMSLYQKFIQNTKSNINRLADFLKLLDKKFSADWICAVSPTNRIENVNAILKEIDKKNSIDDLFSSNVFEINYADLERLLNLDIYQRRYAKYLMLKLNLLYQDESSMLQIPSTITIEHILPQNPSSTSQWSKDFSNADRDEWTDKLGNLILISRRKNSSFGNRDFNEKRIKYFNGNINMFSNSIRVFNNYQSWTLKDLKQNHKDVMDKLLSTYR